MNTSTVHPLQKIYRREIQEAFELLSSLKKEEFYSIPKITWWTLKYEELYEYSYNHRHVGSCIDEMGCSCSWKSPESKFSSLYADLQEVVELHKHEKYFKEELIIFENVKDDYPALMQWLNKNRELGSGDHLMFWLKWYEEEQEIVNPIILDWQDEFKLKAEEWKNTIWFCEVFNEVYWTSDACPEI